MFPPALALLAVAAATLVACSKAPTTPTPPVTAPPAVPPPVIESVAAQPARVEVEQDVVLTAVVVDAQPALGALTYQWQANVGTISGSGPAVTWRLDKGLIDVPTPVQATLTVVKPYQALEQGQLVNREHRITRTETVFRAHDSVAEITRLVKTFLEDLFGNAEVTPDEAVVDFSDSCPGKQWEYDDVVANRRDRIILSATAHITNVELNSEKSFAWVTAACTFRDIERHNDREYIVTGRCELTALYEQDRWWLCLSEFRDGESRPAGGRHTRPSVSGRYWDFAR